MKSILLSIKPESVAKILNREKTVKVMKAAPGCELPVTVYIYCTKEGRPFVYGSPVSGYVEEKYIQTFGWNHKEADRMFGSLNGKVVAKFTLGKVEKINYDHDECEEWFDTYSLNKFELYEKSRLDYEQINDYFNGKLGYAWHIDDLEIFDEPKELRIRAPRPWCYVEKKKWAN